MKIIISDSDITHANDVRNSFIQSFGDTAEIITRIESISNFESSFTFAVENAFDMVIRSTVGARTRFLTFETDYYNQHGILCVIPTGQQFPNSQSFFHTGELPTAILTGVGTTSNVGAYKVEFFDSNSEWVSFTNSFIAGKLAKIKDELDCDWHEARLRARLTASNPTPSDISGYGIIDVQAAIDYSNEIPETPIENPEPEPLFLIGEMFASRNGNLVTLEGQEVDGATSYKIYQDGIEVANERTTTVVIDRTFGVPYMFTYKAFNNESETDESISMIIKYFKSKFLLIK